MKKKLKKYFKHLIKDAWRYLLAKVKIYKLKKIKLPQSESLHSAIYETSNNIISDEERTLISQIENMRNYMLDSKTEVFMGEFGKISSQLNKSEIYKNSANKKLLSNIARASLNYFYSLLLFKLIREFKPSICIELGSCVGISAAYQSSALKLNKKGYLITIEGYESLAKITENNIKKLNLSNTKVVCGLFQDKLEKVLKENHPVDYALIDGHHQETATISYFEQFLPYLAEESIMVFDDICWSDGMKRAYKYIKKNKMVKISLEIKNKIGICLLNSKLKKKYVI